MGNKTETLSIFSLKYFQRMSGTQKLFSKNRNFLQFKIHFTFTQVFFHIYTQSIQVVKDIWTQFTLRKCMPPNIQCAQKLYFTIILIIQELNYFHMAVIFQLKLKEPQNASYVQSFNRFKVTKLNQRLYIFMHVMYSQYFMGSKNFGNRF